MASNGTMTPPCPASLMKATSIGSWHGENPFDFALPLAIVQICLVVVLTRSLSFLLRPLHQPRVIAEIIAGILLGPSALGRSQRFLDTVFPDRSLMVLETLASIGLIFFLFLVGLELDLREIRRMGVKVLFIALLGIAVPFVMGIGASFVLRQTIMHGDVKTGSFLVFMGVALSITAFPVLARILAELKLLTTDVGRMAMSAAAVNDVVAWILLALAIALSGTGSPLVTLWVLLAGAAFVAFAAVVIRPALAWAGRRCLEGQPVKEMYVCGTLAAVLAAAFVTDTIGIHALFGAFIIGVMMPKDGPFAGALTEKIEDVVSGLFLPLYFASSGLKTNVGAISGGLSWLLLLLVIVTATFGKVMGTLVATAMTKMPFQERLALGFLMNTKGLVELIVLNIGKDRKVLNEETFAIMVLMALFTTFITTPIVMVVYKPARRTPSYTHRSVLCRDSVVKLRILSCFHSTRNIPTMINLIESSRGTAHTAAAKGRRSGVTIYAMHLMELSERPSAICMVHKARNNGLPFWNGSTRQRRDEVVVAFEAYRQLCSVTIRPMTAISDFSNIHEDIVTSAQEKRAALILLPFHKHLRVDGQMESLGHAFHLINARVLRHAPCSVAVLVDRGLGGTAQVSSSEVSSSVAVLFFGGPDDREALALGARMAEHPGIAATVVRFSPTPAAPGRSLAETGGTWSVTVQVKTDDVGPAADEELLSALRAKAEAGASIAFEEWAVACRAEVVAVVKRVGRLFDLVIAGRATPSPPLVDTSDCPELGPVGSFLASSGFSTTTTALVVQQYDPTRAAEPCEETSEDSVEPETPAESARGPHVHPFADGGQRP